MPTLTTTRTRLRPARLGDLDALVARRNDPAVARYQDWTLPFDADDGTELLTGAEAQDHPVVDSWFMVTVTDPADEVTYGDISFKLTDRGHTVVLGYTFAREHWGRGLATESVRELIGHLFEDYDVSRISAQMHPDNVASAALLERLGFDFEGRARHAVWSDGEVSDDWLYGLTRAEWEEWRARPRQQPDSVRLVEITPENQRSVAALRAHHSQSRFVSSVVRSFGDALFPEVYEGAPVVPWYRAVEADGELVGFVMVTRVTDNHPDPYLWRLLVDRRHQRRGIGTEVLDQVVPVCRVWGADRLEVSWTEGRGSPRPMYEGYGFVPTGRLIDGETEAVLDLS